MRNELPKLRAGEVLLASKRLRKWIKLTNFFSLVGTLAKAQKSAITLIDLESIMAGYGITDCIVELPNPLKLTVAAVYPHGFLVSGRVKTFNDIKNPRRKGEIVIPFINPQDDKQEILLSSRNFSKWLMRTGEIEPDLKKWGASARGAYLSSRLGSTFTPHNSLRTALRPNSTLPGISEVSTPLIDDVGRAILSLYIRRCMIAISQRDMLQRMGLDSRNYAKIREGTLKSTSSPQHFLLPGGLGPREEDLDWLAAEALRLRPSIEAPLELIGNASEKEWRFIYDVHKAQLLMIAKLVKDGYNYL